MSFIRGSGSLSGVAVGSSCCIGWAYDLLRQTYPSAAQNRLRTRSVVHHVVFTLGLAELWRVHYKEFMVVQRLSSDQL